MGRLTVTPAIKDTDKNDTDVWMVELGRHRADPADLDARRRVAPALESGQQVPRVRLVAAGGEGGAGLAAAARRRRSGQAHRRQGRCLRLRLVARQQAARARRRRSGSGGPGREGRGREGHGRTKKTPKPIVIDRYHFKPDVDGFLRGERSHLYLFDVASKKAEPLTTGTFDENVARLVARRQADRLHPEARRRGRRQAAEPRRVRHRREGRRPAAAPDADDGGRGRTAGVES